MTIKNLNDSLRCTINDYNNLVKEVKIKIVGMLVYYGGRHEFNPPIKTSKGRVQIVYVDQTVDSDGFDFNTDGLNIIVVLKSGDDITKHTIDDLTLEDMANVLYYLVDETDLSEFRLKF